MILPFSVVAPVILFVIVFLCKDLSAQTNTIPDTPCPDVFQYKREGNKYIGIMTINDVSFGKNILAVEFSQKGCMEMENLGNLSLNFNKDKIFEYLNAGRPFTYRLDFPLENVVPRVTSIKLNDFQLCSGQPYSAPSRSIKLVHTLNTYSSEKKPVLNRNTRQTSRQNFSESSPSFDQQKSFYPSSAFNPPSDTEPSYAQQSDDSNYKPYNIADLPSFDQQKSSYPSSAFNPPSDTEPSYTQQSDDSNLPGFLKFSPSMRNMTSNPSSLDQPSYTQPSSYNQINIRNSEMTPSTEAAIASTDLGTFDYINSVCGQENLNFGISRLSVGGTIIRKSRFPWIVAIYKRTDDDDDNDDLDFRCGGSLISTRTVVSAAHCFYVGLREIQPEEIVISMGRHNLTDWADANNIDANEVVLHPDYRPTQTNFDADLAIVRFKASVTFTNVVKPICMWQGNKDPREIVGKSGVIVGWGSDGRQKTTIVPTLVNVTVIERITCIRSNIKLVSSKRIICAGNTNRSGPCMGDSGNGLMFRNENKWMLRGTVSATSDSPIQRCVSSDYAIYSDIAMFDEWVHSNMLL